MSATVASNSRMTSSPCTVRPTPCAPATDRDAAPHEVAVGDDRQARGRAERRDGAALVARDGLGGLGIGHRDAVRAEQGAHLGPREVAVTGHEDEDVVVLGAAHDEGLDEVARLDAPRGSRLLEARDASVPGHRVLDAGCEDGVDRGLFAAPSRAGAHYARRCHHGQDVSRPRATIATAWFRPRSQRARPDAGAVTTVTTTLRPDVGRPRARRARTPGRAATAASPGPGPTTTCASGSPASAPPGVSTSSRTAPATSGPGGATPTATPPASSSARTSTPCPTAAPSTARSASSARSPPSTRCARPVSSPTCRSASSTSSTRRAPASASPAPGSRIITGALDADRARGLTDADGVTMAEAWRSAGRDPETLGRDDEAVRRGSAASSSCTSSRARPSRSPPTAATTSPTPPARSPSAPTSGRTAAGASTSPARPTTPAPPASPTAKDAMLGLAESSRPRGRMPWGSVASPPWARSPSSRAASTPSRATSRPGWTRAVRASDAVHARRATPCRREAVPPRRRAPPRSRGPRPRPSTRDSCERLHGILPDAAAARHRGRARRRHPRHARDPERDALRAQPHRRFTLARASPRRPRTATMGSRPSPPS